MLLDVVVARYQEKIGWVRAFSLSRDLCRIFVYNKGGDDCDFDCERLPNVGREANTFLHHIVKHYQDLPEYTMFLQGNPSDHYVTSTSIDSVLLNIKYTTNLLLPCFPISFFLHICYGDGRPDHRGLDIDGFYKELFPERELPNKYVFSPGAMYLVRKDAILARPLVFWEALLERSKTDPSFPWVMERLWMYIYGVEV